MKKNKITKRLSLRAKFKSTSMVEVVIMDEFNHVQIEMIPINFISDTSESKEESEDMPESKEDD